MPASLGLVLAVQLAAGTPARAADRMVPGQFPTIQAAVNAAVNGDRVVLAAGVYTEVVTIAGKLITLDGQGVATIDATGLGSSGVTIVGPATGQVQVRDVTIRGGEGTLLSSDCYFPQPFRYGGGVRIVGGQALLQGVAFRSNTSTFGAGVWYEQGATVSIQDCTFSENNVTEGGAAIAGCWTGAPANLTITGSLFSANTAVASGNKWGVVAPSPGTATIVGSTFTGNSGFLGIVHTPPRGGTNLRVADSTFSNNQRLFGTITSTLLAGSSVLIERTSFTGEGLDPVLPGRGAVLVIGGDVADVTVRDCTFENCATNGVEVFLQAGGIARVERCRFTLMPDSSLGGLLSGEATLDVRDVVIEGGTAGGIVIVRSDSLARFDRVRVADTTDDGLRFDVGENARVDLSNILVTGAQTDAIEFTAQDQLLNDNVVRMTNLTLADNFVGLRMTGANFGSYTLSNSILKGNQGDLLILEPDRPLIRSCNIGGFPLGERVTDLDPLFVDPANGDYRLRADSPLIDRGDNARLFAGLTLDLAGRARRVDAPSPDTGLGGAPVVDLGALEFAPTIVRCTPSDIAGPGGSIGPDGELTADDIIVFVSWFVSADARADIAGAGQQPTPDGEFTADDVILFISRFTQGC